MIRFAVLALVTLFAMSNRAEAVPITTTESLNNFVTIDFSLPVQPASHESLQFSILQGGAVFTPGTAQTTALLYEDAALLGTSVTETGLIARFSTPGGAFAGFGGTLDFAPVADGIASGRVTMLYSGTATMQWETTMMAGFAFGPFVTSPTFNPTITNITVETVAVPEPASAAIFGLAIVGLVAQRWRQRR
jgi:hypothetical protein